MKFDTNIEPIVNKLIKFAEDKFKSNVKFNDKEWTIVATLWVDNSFKVELTHGQDKINHSFNYKKEGDEYVYFYVKKRTDQPKITFCLEREILEIKGELND